MPTKTRPMAGIRNVAIQKPFVRTCWRYSRRMMMASFVFMGLLPQLFGGGGRRGPIPGPP